MKGEVERRTEAGLGAGCACRRVIVCGINYAPEVVGIAPCNVALCEHLAGLGYRVEMVTSFPYYPAWKKRGEDRGRICARERIGRVEVCRCWHYVPARPGAWRRVLHEASYAALAFARLWWAPRPDALIVVSPPLLLGALARVYARLRGVPYWMHVQDLQPEAAMGLGMLPSGGLIARSLGWLARFAYRGAAVVSGITPGMTEAFGKADVPEERIALVWNGIEEVDPGAASERGRFRARHGICERDLLAIYSGNIGEKQGLEVVIEAARILRDAGEAGVRVILAGDGAARARLERLAAGYGLRNLLWLPILEEEEYAAMLVDADLCLIPQREGTGHHFFPSKLLRALAAGVPVVVVAGEESELVWAFRDAGEPGRIVASGDAAALAGVLRELGEDRGPLGAWGARGREWASGRLWSRVLEGVGPRLAEMIEKRVTS